MRAERKSGVSRWFFLWMTLAMVLAMMTGMSFSVLAADGDIVVLYTNDVHCGVDDNIGYDFAVPGNHEFDYGMERFLELADWLDCGYYSGNLTDLRTGSLVFAPYRIFDYGGTKVAYVGAATPESFTQSTPAFFKDEEGNYIYSFGEGENGENLYRQVQAAVDSARKEGAEYVILVAHLGENGSTKFWSSDAVIAHTSGIDACIDGHSHETYDKPVKNKDGEQVLLTQSGSRLEHIGKLIITPDGTIKSEQVSKVPAVSAVDEAGRAVDASTHKYIKKIQAQYEEALKAVIGYSDVELTVNNPVAGTRAVRNAETNLGDLTADAYRYVMGADIGMSNGGGMRAGIAAGNITYQDALSVFPFGNMICLVEATGQPLDVNKTYTVASHNYLLKLGGNGMNMFQGCKLLMDETMSDMEALSVYIRDNLGGNIGAEYAEPAGQGRITVLK